MMDVIKFFENAHSKKRLSHLYLLSGKIGTGKKDLAFKISNIILKEYDKRENLEEIIFSNNHSQIHYIKPDGNVIKKNQIIELQEEFSKTSLMNIPRIYIIENIDLISSAAANSLLKFMEEPDNSEVYGILITANQGNVLETIISRSQVIRVTKNNNEEIVSKLLEDEEISEYVAINVSHLTKDITKAFELAKESNIVGIIEFIELYFNNYNSLTFKGNIEIERNIPFILYERNYYQIFLELFLIHFLDLYRYKIKENIEFNNLEEVYKSIVKGKKSEKIKENIELIQEELTKQKYYINIPLSLEVLIIKLKK